MFHYVYVRNKTDRGGFGCGTLILCIIALCFLARMYSYVWILALPALIYCIFSKKFAAYRIRNVAICAVLLVTSLPMFFWMNEPSKLSSIDVKWGKETFHVNDVVEIKVSPYPSDTEIETLELSVNNIATLDYSNKKAIITFEQPGEAALFFTANGKIQSDPVNITVVDDTVNDKADTEETDAEETDTGEMDTNEALTDETTDNL